MTLFAPDLLAEITVYLRPDGSFQLACSKVPPDKDLHAKILQAYAASVFELAKTFGLSITKIERSP
jgi:hypothetical protein